MLESIENLQSIELQRNTTEKQGLLMRGCWKTLKILETIENAKKHDGNSMFINARMMTEMLESIGNLEKPIENSSKHYGNAKFINAGMLAEML